VGQNPVAVHIGTLSLRAQRSNLCLAQNGGASPLWLSAVILSELVIGATEKSARRQLLETERQFITLNRL
jgi:predicted nucleic acid-binding protein